MSVPETWNRLIEDSFAAFNARDADAFVATMHPDVEAYPLLAELSGTPFRGHAGIRRWLAETLEAWDYQELTLESLTGRGDRGVAFLSLTGVGKASGVEVRMELAMPFEIRDGLCSYFRITPDRDEAMADLPPGDS
jgi:ketosteroid isomerase-like protein